MSSTLDFVRSIHEAWADGDFSRTDWIDPAIEYVRVGEGFAGGTWRGEAGMADAVRDWLSTWENVRMTPEEYREIDDHRVLVFACQAVHGRRSGVTAAFLGASLFEVHDGKVTRLVQYADPERAIEDLGPAASRGDAPD